MRALRGLVMLTTSPDQFLDVARLLPLDYARATAKAVMVVADRNFSVAADTAADNQYLDLSQAADSARAWQQQCDLAQSLRDLGLAVVSFSPLEGAGDSVFPNNAFAAANGQLISGAMRYPSRQRETTHPGIKGFFRQLLGYTELNLAEGDGVAELTGSMIIDHARNVGFCGLSERADEAGAAAMHKAFGLSATLVFGLEAKEYHTNVLLSILAGRAAVACAPEPHYAGLRETLVGLYGDQVRFLTEQEKTGFVANCLAVTAEDVVMSATAVKSLAPETVDFFLAAGFNVHGVEVSELEKAGGSVRCMIAEIF